MMGALAWQVSNSMKFFFLFWRGDGTGNCPTLLSRARCVFFFLSLSLSVLAICFCFLLWCWCASGNLSRSLALNGILITTNQTLFQSIHYLTESQFCEERSKQANKDSLSPKVSMNSKNMLEESFVMKVWEASVNCNR